MNSGYVSYAALKIGLDPNKPSGHEKIYLTMKDKQQLSKYFLTQADCGRKKDALLNNMRALRKFHDFFAGCILDSQ